MILLKIDNYLKESCWRYRDQHFSIKYYICYAFACKISSKMSGCEHYWVKNSEIGLLYYSVKQTLPSCRPNLNTEILYPPLIIAIKGQMHHHDDLGSKCAYTCHLSNKTTRKSVLLSTPQIWLMKVTKKLA